MVVLTGGSPRRLRDALVATGLDERIRDRHAAGALVMGSSAGAMVACATTLLPQWRGNPQSGPGIGLVPGHVVVPHYDGKRGGWVRAGSGGGTGGARHPGVLRRSGRGRASARDRRGGFEPSSPRTQRSCPGSAWRVLGSNQRRLSRRFYRPFPLTTRATRLAKCGTG